MIRLRKSGWATLALIALVGCDSPSPAPSPAPSPSPSPEKKDTAKAPMPEVKPAEKEKEKEKTAAEPAKKADIEGVKLSADEVAKINELPEADRALALAQKICPASDEHLGSMEKPIKVMIKDQPVFLCCGSCVKDAKAKPDEMLAKLGKAPAK